jgi:DNA adenine methylase
MIQAKPFLKWAGGKTQLIPQLEALLPRSIETYYEPFIGGGAFFFHLANKNRFQGAVINDWNPELVNAYRVVRDFTSELIEQLGCFEINKEAFLELRATDTNALSPVRRAARTIYLNKTAFNGLYRLNKKGQFNVPWGKYDNPKVLNVEVLEACAQALHKFAVLDNLDFSETVKNAKEGDVVYFDPPYVPLNATSNFLGYTSEGFGLRDQQRLATCFRELADKGVAVIASNADAPLVHELYQGFERHLVQARRNINSKGGKRGPINEVIIVGRSDRGGL